MWLYMDDRFTEHETGQHPENPGRIRGVNQRLRREGGIASRCQLPTWQPVTERQLEQVHTCEYTQNLERTIHSTAAGTLLRVEADTVVGNRSWEVACLASGAVIDAVDRVLAADISGTIKADRRAAVIARPPGHHALPNAAMGFCLFNHIAVAARHAVVAHQLDRVLIIDFDVHHGNGTQDIFYEDAQVGFLSMHRWPFYPGTGRKEETGSGAGLGTTRNEPVEFGTPVPTILSRFRYALDDMVTRHQPQLILVSAGFDAHHEDPIGSLGLDVEDFATLTEAINNAADTSAESKIVSLMEGGYNLDRLPDCVETHLEAMLDA